MAKAGPKKSTATAESSSGTPPAADKAGEMRQRLIDATVAVLARDGFAHASARAIATEADTVNGSIFYYFGSMDDLLSATARDLADKGIARIAEGLGGPDAAETWPTRLAEVMRREAQADEGKAVMELFVGSRTSPALADEVRAAIDRAIAYVESELAKIVGDSPVTQLVPVALMAEVAAAAFLGLEVLAQNGRDIDLDRLAQTLHQAVALIRNLSPT